MFNGNDALRKLCIKLKNNNNSKIYVVYFNPQSC